VKTRKHNMFKHVCLLTLVVGLCGSIGLAYPPDNAAVLYYKTCLVYQKLDGDLKKELPDVATGKAVPSQAMRDYIKGQADKIKTLADAVRIKACDWGYDYSMGFDMVMAPLGDMRTLARIVLADAHIHMGSGDWNRVIERCRTAYGMARHIKTDSVLVCNLVGIAIEGVTNEVMTKMLSDMSLDINSLKQVRRLLDQVAKDNPGMKSCLAQEVLMVTKYTSASVLQEAINASLGADEKIPDLDQQAFTEAMDYYRQQTQRLTAAFDLEYTKAIQTMEKLDKQTQADARRLPMAKVTQTLMPAVGRCLSAETRGRTELNALRAAVGVYLVKAQQGRLPRQLPAGLPQDLFSGKDFAYQVTDEGFTLRCRGKDLGKDTVHEYTFALAK
jgi:hypothetical protein